jgi:hypothetical protein
MDTFQFQSGHCKESPLSLLEDTLLLGSFSTVALSSFMGKDGREHDKIGRVFNEPPGFLP